jgi:uncharacterized protein
LPSTSLHHHAAMHIADPRQIPSGIFAYTLHPTRLAMLTDGATDDERALAAKHWAYSQQLLTQGALVFAGRTLVQTGDSFAIAIIRAATLDAAREVANADPAVHGGVFRATVFPYQPMLMGEWPPEAVTVP